jgi:hypothetical protein
MLFIIKEDFYIQISQTSFEQLLKKADGVTVDEAIWQQEVPRTVEKMSSYLRARYDVDVIFAPFKEYNAATTFAVGDRLIYNDVKYYCIAESTGNLPTDTDYWTEGDNRNQDLLTHFIDIALYNIYSRLNAVDIPGIRKERYDGDDSRQLGGAIGWLKNIVKGYIQPDFPLLQANQDDQTGNKVIYGYSEYATDRNTTF